MPSEKNPLVAIAGVCGGIMIALTAVVLIFAKEQAWVLAPIVISFTIMGIFFGYFTSKKG